jgi:hypothetical protein
VSTVFAQATTSWLLALASFFLCSTRSRFEAHAPQYATARSQELIAETLFQQGMEPRPFDIGISKFWPCASRKPSRLNTEKSGSLPSPWNHNHTSVEEQDLCTIQASHAVLHKKNFDEGAIPKKDVSQ